MTAIKNILFILIHFSLTQQSSSEYMKKILNFMQS